MERQAIYEAKSAQSMMNRFFCLRWNVQFTGGDPNTPIPEESNGGRWAEHSRGRPVKRNVAVLTAFSSPGS